MIFPLQLPSMPELGTSSGFDFMLKDVNGQGHAKLLEARNAILGMVLSRQTLDGSASKRYARYFTVSNSD